MSFCKIKGISESTNIAEGLHGINTGALGFAFIVCDTITPMTRAELFITKDSIVNWFSYFLMILMLSVNVLLFANV